MKLLFLLLISVKVCFTLNSFFEQNLGYKNNKIDKVKYALFNYLNETFPNFKINEPSKYENCFNNLFEINNGLPNFIYLLSYSGRTYSDLGNEYSCNQQGFSYYLFSYNIYSIDKLDINSKKIFEFFDKTNFYTGICLPNICEDLLKDLFINYKNDVVEYVKFKRIGDYSDENEISSENTPYYSVNKNGDFDKEVTLIEKDKYNAFYIIFYIFIGVLCFEAVVSAIFFLRPYIRNKSKLFDISLLEGNDYDDDDDGTDDDIQEKIIYYNPSISREKVSCFELYKFLYMHFSLSNNIIVLTSRKSIFYSNKNLEIIYKFKILCLILITFSVNFDVYIRLPSRNFVDKEFIYKNIYFILIKFSSFGLNMFICLEGFEALFKFMSYYKKNFFELGHKTMTFKGLLKFFYFSCYKIVSFFILFFVINYLSRYYIYNHYGGKLYQYFADNIYNKDTLEIFKPKYFFYFFYYFGIKENIDEEFLFKNKMTLLIINEFYCFVITILIFFIGIKLKRKIYDAMILLVLLISFISSYLCDFVDKKENELYKYDKITQNISLVKYPLIFFNHYLIGAITGIICFYLRDATTNNSMANQENCPFNIILCIIESIDNLKEKCRKIFIIILIFIQIFICSFYTCLLYIKDDDNVSLDLTFSIKLLFYYEPGAFILLFCIIIILFYLKSLEKKVFDSYSILNLLYQINFSYINTVYILMYTFYCYYETQFKLSYQNLWLSTFGFFFLFSVENLVITLIIIMPFKIWIFPLLLKTISKYVDKNSEDIGQSRYKSYNSINNDTVLNRFSNDFQEDYLEN